MRNRLLVFVSVVLAVGGSALAVPAAVAGASSVPARPASLPATVKVVASGLNQPKKITIGPDGNLVVAVSGDGSVPAGCTTGKEVACLTTTGAIDKVTPSGTVSTLVGNLPSVSEFESPTAPPPPWEATGPSEAAYVNGSLRVLFQNTNIDPTTGNQTYGPGGALLGTLSKFAAGSSTGSIQASFGPFEAQNNPDGGTGAGSIDSDPYSFVPYRGGYAVADAAANDLLWVSPTGAISVLAVFPTIQEGAIPAQAVPDSVALGPNGQLYVGELGGFPFGVGASSVYRVNPGASLAKTTPILVAGGFTSIGDIAFDQSGRLLVLEINTGGIGDLTAPGALLRLNADGTRTVLASAGLVSPTGLAVARDGSVYVSNYGTTPATGGAGGTSGEIVRIATTSPSDQLGAGFGGYRLAASDGGIFTYGSAGFFGSLGGKTLNQPIVGSAGFPTGPGYWLVASDGGVFTFGVAGFYGSTGSIVLNKPIVGMAPTPDGRGYWLVASDGGVFSFGDATFHGSAGSIQLRKPIVSMSATPDGGGYYLVAADGGVFTFGDAKYQGSTGAITLKQPIVSSGITPDGGGYYLIAADGGVFTFGDAKFKGSTGGITLDKPIVGSQITPDGGGYYLVASDGGVFSFGDAPFYGSAGGIQLVKPVVSMG